MRSAVHFWRTQLRLPKEKRQTEDSDDKIRRTLADLMRDYNRHHRGGLYADLGPLPAEETLGTASDMDRIEQGQLYLNVDRTQWFLLGHPVQNGTRLEVYRDDEAWHPGKFHWSELSEDFPTLELDAGGFHELVPDDPVRWAHRDEAGSPSRRGCSCAAELGNLGGLEST